MFQINFLRVKFFYVIIVDDFNVINKSEKFKCDWVDIKILDKRNYFSIIVKCLSSDLTKRQLMERITLKIGTDFLSNPDT